MTSDNNNWVTEGGKNGEIVFEMRMLFVEVKNEQGGFCAPLKISFVVDLLLVATGSHT